MFSSVQVQMTTGTNNCQINYSNFEDSYVYSGEESIYIQNSLEYKIFNANISHFKYFTDILPVNKDATVQYPSCRMYPGTEGTVIFHSYSNPFTAVLYRELNQPENFVSFDIDNKSLIDGSNISYPTVTLNRKIPILNVNQRLKRNSLFFVSDALIETDFDPRFEKMVYPIGLTEFASLYLLFENLEWDKLDVTLDYVSDDVSIDKKFSIYRPKFLFGDIAGNWWAWDFVHEQWVQRSPSGDYFEFSEFRTVANTYTEYLRIPQDSFISKFNIGNSMEIDRRDSVTVLINNYNYIPKLVSNNYWTSQYDSGEYLYVLNKPSKSTFVIGSI